MCGNSPGSAFIPRTIPMKPTGRLHSNDLSYLWISTSIWRYCLHSFEEKLNECYQWIEMHLLVSLTRVGNVDSCNSSIFGQQMISFDLTNPHNVGNASSSLISRTIDGQFSMNLQIPFEFVRATIHESFNSSNGFRHITVNMK